MSRILNIKMLLMASIAPMALASAAAHAEAASSADAGAAPKEAASPAAKKQAFTTGVAKGRDLLDSAISASALDDTEIEKLGARSLSEIVRTIPGIRAEAASGEGDGSFTIRGLPMAATGAKYLQFQEDGLPVLEFGDMTTTLGPDLFLRSDLNLSQIQTIRGGSASTFASNAPGGVINLISKTGDVEGGAVEVTTGLDYGMKRVDMEYGGKISDTLRYHIGGFYRQGEGQRDVGYDAYKGGQIKFNVTKDFEGGYIRFYGKYLNDRVPDYTAAPLHVSGSNSSPDYTSVPGFDIKKDTVLSRNITTYPGLDDGNNRASLDMRNGLHPVVKAGGVEVQYDLKGWTISEKFRYEAISGSLDYILPLTTAPAPALAFAFGGPGATLSYATGPHAGQVITNPATLNGNGLMSFNLFIHENVNSLDNVTNDIRATHVWNVGGGSLTTTAGVYHAGQTYDTSLYLPSTFSDVLGGGNSSLINITTATGVHQTQDGFYSFSLEGLSAYRRSTNIDYTVDAPYASANYHIDKLSVGGSLRYDIGSARGSYNGAELGGGRFGVGSFDMNGDGVISPAESRTAFLPLTNPAPVNYDWHYLSYSAGVNYRFSEGLAVFGRYSRGGRAAADRVLFTPSISLTTGDLVNSKGYDPVKQAEVGVKFRRDNLALNLTGFWASTQEQNSQLNTDAAGNLRIQDISREYQAYGAEFEGDYSMGPFRIAAGATYTSAEIKQDVSDPTVVGNTPRHQPSFMYSVTPQYETGRFTVGANITGVTSSYSEDVNQLKMPGYTTVNAFVQYRPVDRVQLSINANNLFDAFGLTEVTQGAIPVGGTVYARAIAGRTVSASLRLSF